MRRPIALLTLPIALLFGANSGEVDFDQLTLTYEDGAFYAEGTLVPESGDHIDAARRKHRGVRVLVMEYVPGSDDDNDYMDAAWKLHRAGYTMVVPSDGLIASGGTDFFLAGRNRIIEPGACIGVHSWEDSGPPSYQATDLPRNHEDHQDFLEYFKAIGISPQFYWFTIAAAPADGMYWMSPAEMNRFKMSTKPVPLSRESGAQRAARCNLRAEEG